MCAVIIIVIKHHISPLHSRLFKAQHIWCGSKQDFVFTPRPSQRTYRDCEVGHGVRVDRNRVLGTETHQPGDAGNG